jgi:hypothetical protein
MAESERVTALPVSETIIKVKDPRRIAAGKVGAATRKAKQLEQLRLVKTGLREPNDESINPGLSQPAVAPVATNGLMTPRQPPSSNPAAPSLTPYIVGGVGLLAVGLLIRSSLQTNVPPRETAPVAHSRAASPRDSAPAVEFPQLKPKNDPFYME